MIAMILGVAGLAINLLGAILLATAQGAFFQTLSNMVYGLDATEDIRAAGGPEVRFGGLAGRHKQEIARNARKVRWGWVLMIAGFIIQGAGTVCSFLQL